MIIILKQKLNTKGTIIFKCEVFKLFGFKKYIIYSCFPNLSGEIKDIHSKKNGWFPTLWVWIHY